MNPRLRHLLSHLAALVLAVVFLFAAADKFLHPVPFAWTLSRYQLLPIPLVPFFASLLPWAETVSAFALLLPGRPRRAAALCCFLMLLLFSAAFLLARARGLELSCGCFSAAATTPTPLPLFLLRNTALLLLAAFLLLPPRPKPPSPP